jgi:hypothetical protein
LRSRAQPDEKAAGLRGGTRALQIFPEHKSAAVENALHSADGRTEAARWAPGVRRRDDIAPVQAAAIQAAVDLFETALADAVDPAQRTPVNIAAKDEARNNATQLCRQVATLIKYNAGIANPDKMAIGVRPVNPSRNPINCTHTSPILT